MFFNPEVWTEVQESYFYPRHWQQNRAVIGQASGRGTTLFFRYQDRDCVLRHYHRGGMVSRISDDRYFYLGLSRSRVWREFKLLAQIRSLGLKAPLPIAARLKRQGFSCRADLITEKIDNARDMADLLSHKRLLPEEWARIGETIAQYHLNGIYHADLNLRNIMLDDQQQVWLIDWDNGRNRRPAKSWRQANLDRLLRSLEKEQKNSSHCHWLRSDWQCLIEGYQASFKQGL